MVSPTGEHWTLKVELTRPGRDLDGGMVAAFACDDVERNSDVSGAIDAILGRKPVRTRLTVDLNLLFQPLIEIVGMPEQ